MHVWTGDEPKISCAKSQIERVKRSCANSFYLIALEMDGIAQFIDTICRNEDAFRRTGQLEDEAAYKESQ